VVYPAPAGAIHAAQLAQLVQGLLDLTPPPAERIRQALEGYRLAAPLVMSEQVAQVEQRGDGKFATKYVETIFDNYADVYAAQCVMPN